MVAYFGSTPEAAISTYQHIEVASAAELHHNRDFPGRVEEEVLQVRQGRVPGDARALWFRGIVCQGRGVGTGRMKEGPQHRLMDQLVAEAAVPVLGRLLQDVELDPHAPVVLFGRLLGVHWDLEHVLLIAVQPVPDREGLAARSVAHLGTDLEEVLRPPAAAGAMLLSSCRRCRSSWAEGVNSHEWMGAWLPLVAADL